MTLKKTRKDEKNALLSTYVQHTNDKSVFIHSARGDNKEEKCEEEDKDTETINKGGQSKNDKEDK